MALSKWALEMAQYNRWQNQNLAQTCQGLPEDAITADAGMFFGSILRTLNHILLVDSWFYRLMSTGRFPKVDFDPEEQLHARFSSLCDHRRRLDCDIVDMMRSRQEAWYAESITVFTSSMKAPKSYPRFFLLAQMFNHATHHRSQVTSELFRRSVDYGNTDLPDCPYSSF